MNDITLSICIPTYNRAKIVHEIVLNVLLCFDPDIEVIILDNGSTDDTLSRLRSIKDERLVIYSNEENKGGLYNVVNVIDKAKGQYLMFSTDKDQIDYRKINEFKLFLLQHPNLASGYCEFHSTSIIKYEIFHRGYDAIKNIAYKGRHPTGYFFKNRLLKSLNHVERFSDYNLVDMFPFEFIHAELCLLGNGAIYHEPIVKLEPEEMAAKHKSYNAKGTSSKAFFSPTSRLKMAINYTNHIETLNLNLQEKKKLIIGVFIQQLIAATVGYKSILKNESICAHYHMKCKDLSIKELLYTGLNFYKKYRVIIINTWGGSFFSQIVFSFQVLYQLVIKIQKKAFNYIKK